MSIIEFIQDRARYYNCPVCGKSLKGCSVRMLQHVEDRFTVRLTCAACHVTFIVILAIQGSGLEPLADDELALESVEQLPGRDPIEWDEILDLHLLLKEFDGPLSDLVQQPDRTR